MSLEEKTIRNVNDPTAYPWYGTAGHGMTPFNTTLISHLTGNLWMGGCIDGLVLPEDFKYVVSLYPWEQYKLPESCTRVEVRMYDGHSVPEEPLIWGLAAMVNKFIDAGKTLVHCQAGLNRSGLIVGAAMIADGAKPSEVINWLREKRTPAVLCNPHFEQWLLEQKDC